jgi:hypothetical protein
MASRDGRPSHGDPRRGGRGALHDVAGLARNARGSDARRGSGRFGYRIPCRRRHSQRRSHASRPVTAATLWATAAIGVLAGSGFFEEAAVGAVVIVGVNLLFQPMAEAMARRAVIRGSRKRTEVRTTSFTLNITCAVSAADRIREVVLDTVDRSTLSLRSLRSTMPARSVVNVTLQLTQPGFDRNLIEQLTTAIAGIDEVTSVTWEAVEEPV